MSWSIALAIVLGTGYGNAAERSAAAKSAASPAGNASELPWMRLECLGFDRLESEGNATTLRKVWNLPETVAFRGVILDRLARLLAPGFPGAGLAAADRALLLRPLLDDVLRAEAALEVVGSSNAVRAWTLAVHVGSGRTNLWRENWEKLAATGHGTNGAWAFVPARDNWIFLAHDSAGRGADVNTPLLRKKENPGMIHRGVGWLELEADLPRWSAHWPALAGAKARKLAVSVERRGQGLKTEARLDLSEPLGIDLVGWQVPTNTIRDPIISFTAVQGFKKWLGRQGWFRELGLDSAPNQLFAWAQSDTPFQIQAAFPVENATNTLGRINTTWLPGANVRLKTSPVDVITYYTNLAQMTWHGWIWVKPYLRKAPESNPEFLNAGLFPLVSQPGRKAPPPELFAQVTTRTNLLYYDWEITQMRLAQLRETLGIISPVLNVPNMATNEVGGKWLAAIEPMLGNTVTEIAVAEPRSISITRRADLGFNGAELIALASWLTSADFPAAAFKPGFRPPELPRSAKPSPAPAPAASTPKPGSNR